MSPSPAPNRIPPINLSLSADVLEALDEARGRLNRQTWIRQTIIERLRDENFYRPRTEAGFELPTSRSKK